MPRLVVNMDQARLARIAPYRGPHATVGANIRRPFYRTPAYLTLLAVLTLAAAGTMGLAIWRLFHFVH